MKVNLGVEVPIQEGISTRWTNTKKKKKIKKTIKKIAETAKKRKQVKIRYPNLEIKGQI